MGYARLAGAAALVLLTAALLAGAAAIPGAVDADGPAPLIASGAAIDPLPAVRASRYRVSAVSPFSANTA